MGNTLGGSKTTTKIMNINGETTKYKTPIHAMEITKHHPGHVLIDSDSVRAYGVRAKPIDPTRLLEPKKVYFLVEQPSKKEPRRVMSSGDIHVGAQDRLERLVMTRRSVSDLSVNGSVVVVEDGPVKIRLPKAEVERLVRESKDQKEAGEKIFAYCMAKAESGSGSDADTGSGSSSGLLKQLPLQAPGKSPLGRDTGCKKRVRFSSVNEGITHESRTHHMCIRSRIFRERCILCN